MNRKLLQLSFPRKRESTKGFTLIEMLVVIGIIGLLASVVLVGLGNARKGGRDARRIADLRSIQSGLESYYNSCGYYPGKDTAGCEPFTGTETLIMVDLNKALSNLGASPVPEDPAVASGHPAYVYTTDGQSYVLKAVLETHSSVLDNSFSGDAGVAFTGSPACDPTSPVNEFCLIQ